MNACGDLYPRRRPERGAQGSDVWTLRQAGRHLAWARHGRMPEARLSILAAAIGRTIYVMGGTQEFEPFDAKGTCCTSRSARTTLWSLDTSDPAAQWKVLAPFPGKPRWTQRTVAGRTVPLRLSAGAYQARAEDPVSTYNVEVWRYETGADRWSLVAKLPEAMQGSVPVVVHGQVVLVGSSQTVLAFDPVTFEYRALSALPRKASVDDFVVMGPLLVGAMGENAVEGAAPPLRSGASSAALARNVLPAPFPAMERTVPFGSSGQRHEPPGFSAPLRFGRHRPGPGEAAPPWPRPGKTPGALGVRWFARSLPRFWRSGLRIALQQVLEVARGPGGLIISHLRFDTRRPLHGRASRPVAHAEPGARFGLGARNRPSRRRPNGTMAKTPIGRPATSSGRR